MPFELKSKGRALVIRAGTMPDDPMYHVGPSAWVLFDELPPGVDKHGDGDVDVRELGAESKGDRGKLVEKKAPPKRPAADPKAESELHKKKSKLR